MIRTIHDRMAAEVIAAENRRRGAPIQREYTDPRRAEIRRRLEEIADAKRLREMTEWL
jgi:hypothetical protein